MPADSKGGTLRFKSQLVEEAGGGGIGISAFCGKIATVEFLRDGPNFLDQDQT